jgi:diguanylate cyclase (GGDEF)-like protein
MSFRKRLTSLFVLIVVIPMAAVGLLVFRSIGDSQQGKAQARANGIASAAASVYQSASRSASFDARMVARTLRRTRPAQLRGRLSTIVAEAGLARVTVTIGTRQVADAGGRTAVAPGVALVRASASQPAWKVTASELTAPQFARDLAGSGFDVVVSQGGRTIGTSLPAARGVALPSMGSIRLGNDTYETVTQSLGGFGSARVRVTVLSNQRASGGSVSSDRLLAALLIGGFLILAFCFLLLRSRALERQLASFLQAARRLGSGDFSSPIPTTGRDEFAALGREFNSMSVQLANRLDELERERARVRQSIRRIGEAFAANLDREGLLDLALKTAMDATTATRGRISARERESEPLSETTHFGRLDGLDQPIYESERQALEGDGLGQASADGLYFATVALGPIVPGGSTHGLITVCRSDQRFSADDQELLRSLATRATLALANVNLHFDMQRQAVTDDLTGLATHGYFQDLLAAEMAEVRRYRYPVGLIMSDLDDFKSINDLYGHQQGDVVLRQVAEVLRQNSRDPDVPARYGGEELALILPHTDLEGTYAIAERIRESIEQIEVPLLNGGGSLQVTASIGAAASSDGHKNDLISAADNALYVAKREGKNITIKAEPETANVFGGE